MRADLDADLIVRETVSIDGWQVQHETDSLRWHLRRW